MLLIGSYFTALLAIPSTIAAAIPADMEVDSIRDIGGLVDDSLGDDSGNVTTAHIESRSSDKIVCETTGGSPKRNDVHKAIRAIQKIAGDCRPQF